MFADVVSALSALQVCAGVKGRVMDMMEPVRAEIKRRQPSAFGRTEGGSSAIVRAEIDSQIATAKEYPRDIRAFKDRLMSMATIDAETAAGCYYALPRDGKTVDGPSIRMAEIALAAYQNCIAEADVVDEDERYVYAIGMCRDLENNTAVRMKVRRRITDKNGRRYSDDMIAVTANAACAIALRNAILKIVPAAYVKPVYVRCRQVAVGQAKSLANRRAEVLVKLAKMGATEARVLYAVNRRSVDEITADDLAKLIGMGTAVYEGETSLDEAFPEPPKESAPTTNGTVRATAKAQAPEPDEAETNEAGEPGDPGPLDPEPEPQRTSRRTRQTTNPPSADQTTSRRVNFFAEE